MTPLAWIACHALLFVSGLAGGGSLGLFAWFLYWGSFDLLRLPLGSASALALDAALCLTFFVQHSGMIRRSYRRVLAKLAPEDYHGALYSIVSGVVLTMLVVGWQRVGPTLWDAHAWLRWTLRASFLAAILGFFLGTRALGDLDAFGLRPIRRRLRGGVARSRSLAAQGPYRWVRHPLYSFVLVMIWTSPTVTVDRLLFDLLFSAWIVISCHLEERDLVVEFGAAYRGYQRRVPMLVPGFRRRDTSHS
jgi:protein-S-isoprenylcysteine O-methyltransferase Ste14